MKFLDRSLFETSMEVYFGDTNPFKTEMIETITRIFNELQPILAHPKISQNNTNRLKGFGKLIGEVIKKHCRVERCDIGFTHEMNASAVPLCLDPKVILPKSQKSRKREEENPDDPHNYDAQYAISLEDIVETKNGFQFRDSKGKFFIIIIGLPLFKPPLTPEMICAALFHEIGHCFQHMLQGINVNLVHSLTAGFIRNNILTLNQSKIQRMKRAVDSQDKEKQEEIIQRNIHGNKRHYYREKALDKLSNRDADVVVMKSASQKKENFVLRTVVGLLKTFYYSINPIKRLIVFFITPDGFNVLRNYKFLKKNRMYEQFADSFVTSYGLGIALSQFQKEIKTLTKKGLYDHYDLGALSFLYLVPLINVYLAYNGFIGESLSNLLSGYETSNKRIANSYKTLEYELKNNPDLAPQHRKEIEQQMEEIEEIYDKCLKTKGLSNIVFRVFRMVFKKTIQKEKTNIRENVLDVIQSKKLKGEFKE